MKTIRILAAFFMLAALTSAIVGCNPSENKAGTNSGQDIIVLLKFKAQPDKGIQAVKEITGLLEKVKEEPHFISIKLHVDPNDNTNILLYEEWEDESYYNNEHMNTAYIKEFMANSRNFLEGPPDISFWKVENKFK
ncbi:MAG: putative quinol monooxygenase [bacterium]|jgi:quinol monooxygenase YgiN